MENFVKIDLTDISLGEYEGTESPPKEFDFEPVAHKMRLTFSGQDKELKCLDDNKFTSDCYRTYRRVLNRAIEGGYFLNGKYTSGIEKYNKEGNTTWLHVHLHFWSVKQTLSMRKSFKRWFEEEDQDTTGNKNFMFKADIVRDKMHFMQYPLKQNLNKNICGGYTAEQLDVMHEQAQMHYKTIVSFNQQKRDKMDTTDTLFERVIRNIEKTNVAKTRRNIAKAFYQLYIDENRPINKTTIAGYVVNAQVRFKMLSIDEVLDQDGY